MPGKINLKEERFILNFGFRAFKPWLHGTMPSGSWQEKNVRMGIVW
jgi:hypothetical protein